MIISAKVVKSPRWSRRCGKCDRDILGPQLKLYGYAHYGEKPYNLYLHLDCGDISEIKIRQALEDHLIKELDEV